MNRESPNKQIFPSVTNNTQVRSNTKSKIGPYYRKILASMTNQIPGFEAESILVPKKIEFNPFSASGPVSTVGSNVKFVGNYKLNQAVTPYTSAYRKSTVELKN